MGQGFRSETRPMTTIMTVEIFKVNQSSSVHFTLLSLQSLNSLTWKPDRQGCVESDVPTIVDVAFNPPDKVQYPGECVNNAVRVTASSAHARKVRRQEQTKLFCFTLGRMASPRSGLCSYKHHTHSCFIPYARFKSGRDSGKRSAFQTHLLSVFF